MNERPLAEQARGGRARVGTPDERGFSLMEVIVATAIAAIAVVGMAYTFGTGQGLIGRYEVARSALGSAQQRMEALAVADTADTALTIGTHQSGFVLDGQPIGLQRWVVSWVDDPADGTGGADADGNTNDLKRVALEVSWMITSLSDTIRFSRLLPAP